jgi:hypothetical protein
MVSLVQIYTPSGERTSSPKACNQRCEMLIGPVSGKQEGHLPCWVAAACLPEGLQQGSILQPPCSGSSVQYCMQSNVRVFFLCVSSTIEKGGGGISDRGYPFKIRRHFTFLPRLNISAIFKMSIYVCT